MCVISPSPAHRDIMHHGEREREWVSLECLIYTNLYLLEAPPRHPSARSQTRGGSYRAAGGAAQHSIARTASVSPMRSDSPVPLALCYPPPISLPHI
jgi:hypothetical protein